MAGLLMAKYGIKIFRPECDLVIFTDGMQELSTVVESRFYKPPREAKNGSKNRRVREIGGKITVFDPGGETTFGSSYRGVRKTEGSRNQNILLYF